MELKYIVNNTNNYITIHQVLKNEFNMSNRLITKLKQKNLILLNNSKTYLNKKILIGDVVTCNLDYEEESENIVPTKMDLNIIYEDDDLIVINKQKGLVVHPGAGNYDNTLVNGILYHTNQLSDINGYIRPGIVHRIDKDTSGLLVVCKNNYAHKSIAMQLQDKTCYRKYICVVEGTITNDEGVIDAPIGRDSHNRQKMCVTDKNSKEAVTNFKVLDRFSNYSLIECELKTGRTHQIRVHMSYIKHSVVNDLKYNNKQINTTGQYLHAYYLSFVHPTTNKRVEYISEIPDYIKKFVIENGGTYFK